MSSDKKKEAINTDYIDKVYDDLKTLYLEDGLQDSLYFKGLITLAYEYIILADISNCVHLISECDSYYLNNILETQMEEDPKFKEVVIKLVDILEKAGIPLDSIESEDEVFWMGVYTKTVGRA